MKEKTMFLLEEPQRRQFPIMVNFHVINLKGFRITMETHLCAASMKTFPERLNWGKKTHPECGQYCPVLWVGVLDWTQSRVWVWALTLLSLLPDQGWVMISCLVLLLHSFLTVMNYTFQLWATTALLSWDAVYSAPRGKKVSNRVHKWVKACRSAVATTVWNAKKINGFYVTKQYIKSERNFIGKYRSGCSSPPMWSGLTLVNSYLWNSGA